MRKSAAASQLALKERKVVELLFTPQTELSYDGILFDSRGLVKSSIGESHIPREEV